MNEYPKRKYVTNEDGTYSEAVVIEGASNITVEGVDGAITDGTDADIKATVKDLANSNPLVTQIVDEDGDVITSFGGGGASDSTENVDGTKKVTEALFAEADSVSTRGIIDHFSGTAGALNGEVVALKCVGYAWMRIQILGTWVGTVSFQGSMDGWTWSTVGLNDANQLGSFPLSNVTSNRLLYGPINYNYFRAYFSSYTSGSATALVSLDGQSPGTLVIGGAVGVSNSPAVSLNSGTMSYTNQSVATAPRGSQPAMTSVDANGEDLLVSTDLANYASASITVAGTWTGTLSVQFSDDNGGFTTAPCVYPIAGAVQDSITANGQYVIKGFFGRYMRIRATAWTSGTATATLTLHTKENSAVNQQGVRQAGAWSVNASAVAGQTTTNVGTTSTLISNTNASRKGLIICNTGAVPVSINLTGATATLGMLTLPAGSQPLSILSYVPLTSITAITGSGTTDVSVTELF